MSEKTTNKKHNRVLSNGTTKSTQGTRRHGSHGRVASFFKMQSEQDYETILQSRFGFHPGRFI